MLSKMIRRDGVDEKTAGACSTRVGKLYSGYQVDIIDGLLLSRRYYNPVCNSHVDTLRTRGLILIH